MKNDKKKNIVIGVLVTVLFITLILVLNSNISLVNNKTSNSNDKLTNEVIDKDKDEISEENNSNKSDIKNHTTEILNETEALKIIKELSKKYFEYFYSLGPYCGGYTDDYLSFGSYETMDFRDYYASSNYNSIDELKEYYSSFMANDLYPNYLNDNISYLEQDGKLYCQLSHKGCGDIYNENDSYYTIHSINENVIVSNAIVISNSCGDEKNKREGIIEIIKNSEGNWIVSKYDIELSDLD